VSENVRGDNDGPISMSDVLRLAVHVPENAVTGTACEERHNRLGVELYLGKKEMGTSEVGGRRRVKVPPTSMCCASVFRERWRP
jgi:hypothetical protein